MALTLEMGVDANRHEIAAFPGRASPVPRDLEFGTKPPERMHFAPDGNPLDFAPILTGLAAKRFPGVHIACSEFPKAIIRRPEIRFVDPISGHESGPNASHELGMGRYHEFSLRVRGQR